MSALDYGYGGSSFSDGYGLLKSSNSKGTKAFMQGSMGLCGGQIVGGAIMVLVSFIYLYEHMFVMGTGVGVVVCLSGAIGIAGTQRKNRDAINFHIVGGLVGVMLTSQFVGLLWREVSVNCALAELFLKTRAIEDIIKEMARQEAFNSVHERLNELEDMIDVVHMGVETTVEYLKDNPTGDPARQERDFIRRKINVVRHHTHKLLEELKAQEDAKEGTKDRDSANLRGRIATAEHILTRIEKHDESELEHAFTPHEYEGLFRALIRVMGHTNEEGALDIKHADLKEIADQMEGTKGVLNSIAEGVNVLSGLQEDTDALTAESRQRREKYAEEFKNIIDVQKRHSVRDLTAYALHYMPEHCVRERHGMHYVGIVGLIVASLQMATIYMGLCVAFRIPVKSD